MFSLLKKIIAAGGSSMDRDIAFFENRVEKENQAARKREDKEIARALRTPEGQARLREAQDYEREKQERIAKKEFRIE